MPFLFVGHDDLIDYPWHIRSGTPDMYISIKSLTLRTSKVTERNGLLYSLALPGFFYCLMNLTKHL